MITDYVILRTTGTRRHGYNIVIKYYIYRELRARQNVFNTFLLYSWIPPTVLRRVYTCTINTVYYIDLKLYLNLICRFVYYITLQTCKIFDRMVFFLGVMTLVMGRRNFMTNNMLSFFTSPGFRKYSIIRYLYYLYYR